MLFWVVNCRSIRFTFCSRSCTREHTLSEVIDPAHPPMAVVLVPLFVVADSTTIVGPLVVAAVDVMWIVLVLRVMGVGDMLRLRRFTLTGRLLLLVVTGTSLALLLALSDEMAILVERADIDLVITLLLVVVLVVVLLLLVLLECCSTLLLVNRC